MKVKYFFMIDRKLKVYSKYRPLASTSSGHIVPELRLCGLWLEQSGFKIGEQVQITVKEGQLIIEPLKD